jgi:hypothetical protein
MVYSPWNITQSKKNEMMSIAGQGMALEINQKPNITTLSLFADSRPKMVMGRRM